MFLLFCLKPIIIWSANVLLYAIIWALTFSGVKFVNDLVASVDSKIDFTGIDAVIVVVPPGTPLNIFQQAAIKDFRTNEGHIRVGTTEYPFTLNNFDKVKQSKYSDETESTKLLIPCFAVN